MSGCFSYTKVFKVALTEKRKNALGLKYGLIYNNYLIKTCNLILYRSIKFALILLRYILFITCIQTL